MWTTHNLHPDTHEYGLADGCERCAEIAADPFVGFDDNNLAALVERTRQWINDREFPRSENEKIAMRLMEKHLVHQRIIERVVWYK